MRMPPTGDKSDDNNDQNIFDQFPKHVPRDSPVMKSQYECMKRRYFGKEFT